LKDTCSPRYKSASSTMLIDVVIKAFTLRILVPGVLSVMGMFRQLTGLHCPVCIE